MAVELEMPELAESVIEGEIVKWLVKEGEHVALDQPLVEVMTDKVTVEVPSPYEGILLKQVAPEGAVVPIGKPIAIFGKEGESLDAHHAAKQEASAGQATPPASPAPPPAAATAQDKSSVPQPPAKPARGNGQAHGGVSEGEKATLSQFGRPLAAPAVRKFARELGVDLSQVRGSGDGGRIRREDVERVAKSGKSQPRGAARPQAVEAAGATERVPLRGLRRVIAEHMVLSKHTAAHTLHVDEADL